MRGLFFAAFFAVVFCVPARCWGFSIAADGGGLRAEYAKCSWLKIIFPSLEREAPFGLPLSSLSLDGSSDIECGEPEARGDAGFFNTLKTAAGRSVTLFVRIDPDEADGTVLAEFVPADGKMMSWNFTFGAEKGEHFYGFGEKFNAFDQRGKVVSIKNVDALHGVKDGVKGDRSYKTVPFFMSHRGYGFWLDDTAVAQFDMDSLDAGAWRLSFESDRARLYFFAGPRLAKVMERFTALAGRTPVWPTWVYAPWKSRDVHRRRTDFGEDVLRQRELDIPGSAIVIDSPWETCYNDFQFNELQFPESEKMLAMARGYGYRTLLWLTPMVNVINNIDMEGIQALKCDDYVSLKKRKAFVSDDKGQPAIVEWWKGGGSVIDFTNPTAAEFWTKKLQGLLKYGASGFKIDDGETDYAIDAKYANGEPAAIMRNKYALLYAKATYEAIKRAGGDGVVWQRAGAAGAWQYAIPWAGDNRADFGPDGLPSVVIAGQSISMSGYPVWGHDIGGYIGTPDAELFVRWAQFGALTPIMQIHTSANIGAWSFGEGTMRTYRRYARLHTSLFPYIYSLNQEAAETGMPMIRPLPLLYQDDPQAHAQRYEYQFGSALLVAPVVIKGAVTRGVYFPKGANWIDFWTGAIHRGGVAEVVAAPLDTLPLFVREGAILTMLPDDIDTLVDPLEIKWPSVKAIDDRLVVRVYPGEELSALKTWEGMEIEALHMPDGVEACLSDSKSPRRVMLQVFMQSASRMDREGVEQKKASCDQISHSKTDWCYDARERMAISPVVASRRKTCFKFTE